MFEGKLKHKRGNSTLRFFFSPADWAVLHSIIDIWHSLCKEIIPQLQLHWKMFLFSPAELLTDWKHIPAMADPQRTAALPGALRSTPTPRRSRHVHVWDGLFTSAVPPPSGNSQARGWSHFTTFSHQCKHRSTNAGSLWFVVSRWNNDAWLGAGVGFSFIQSFIKSSFIASQWSMLNLVWPLSRLGGVLWGRLLPPSLPSPLPCPGRGMRDLEGLSTDVLKAVTNRPAAWPHSLLYPDLCL